MIRVLRNLGYYAKALEALLGTLLLFSTLLLTINGWLPAELAKQVGAALVALTTFRVWLTANGNKLDQLGDQAADALERATDHAPPNPHAGGAP